MDLSEFDIDFLSQKLSDNPQSPLFARLADLYLSKNQSSEALKLCEAGVQTYASYATGYVVLGKCYLALKENSKARIAFSQSLHLAPFNQVARKLLDEVPFTGEEPVEPPEAEATETAPPEIQTQPSPEPQEIPEPIQEEAVQVQEPAAIEEQVPVQIPEPESIPADESSPVFSAAEEVPQEVAREEKSATAELPIVEPAELPGVEEYIQQHSANSGTEKLITLDEYLGNAAEPPPPTTELDSLAAQLEKAERIVPPEPEPEPSSTEAAPLDSVVITPTLAEIYASQGEYGAAIQAYEILMLSKPDEQERFEKRIKELQAKLYDGG